MYWRIVIDHGNYRNYHTVRSSEFAANLIADNWRSIAKAKNDNVVITVETINSGKEM